MISQRSNTQRTTFNSLALELKQAIYQYAAIDDDHGNQNEIRVTYILDKKSHDGIGTLQSQTLTTLEKLLKVDSYIWQEAIDYLTGPLFCWVLVSDAQPHMFLLRALRKNVPKEVLSRVGHVHLLRVSIQRHTYELVERHQARGEPSELSSFEDIISASPYLSCLGNQYTMDDTTFTAKVKRDISYAMTLLPHAFPSLHRLDISLDTLDCLVDALSPSPIDTHHVQDLVYLTKDIRRPLVTELTSLKHMESIAIIEICVFWEDSLGSHRPPGYDLSDKTLRTLQQTFIEALRLRIPAKSITGYA